MSESPNPFPVYKLEELESLKAQDEMPDNWSTDVIALRQCDWLLDHKAWSHIEGLRPVLADKGGEGMYVLKDRYGFWYLLETEPYGGLWAAKEAWDEWFMIGAIRMVPQLSRECEYPEEVREWINVEEPGAIYPYVTRLAEARSKESHMERTAREDTCNFVEVSNVEGNEDRQRGESIGMTGVNATAEASIEQRDQYKEQLEQHSVGDVHAEP